MKHFNGKLPTADILSQVEIGERFLVSPAPGLVGLFFLQKTGQRSCRRVHLDWASVEELAEIRQVLNHCFLPRTKATIDGSLLRDYDDTVSDFEAGYGRC